ncbi:transcriptional regulator [Liquorilactobacillus sucicola DSM 21376 = JCM 15457]|uniref:Fucose operon repressor, deor family protein n=2 Tax=Liquorilactobacillus sucicola TaxID=519050 RepID=A0A023CXP7_9LACO|nr:DeoR/GlpR family DNA-binding transcription regulator [Liquorilactobacillus sucicola]AJA34340.1 transcriptional regulator [Liquorilactobacillus sucicola]KRN06878.1 fucose operon repressor, deor family protein [Liquorilactobacillus sucicola DSM 21376 = JCM 15457]GAJ26356.1 transcriptional regulator [Liquorilactobacillus sucicola DSM 21376 = JCM 15457]
MTLNQSEREKKIIEILMREKNVNVNNLKDLLKTSISTLRRDLIALESTNIIKRSHGTVSLLQNSNIEFAYATRRQANEDIKNKLCRKASQFITDNSAIFLDASSTLSFLPKYLSNKKNLHIITNSIHIALEVNYLNNIDLSILGGKVAFESGAVLGGKALSDLINYFRPDLSFLSCSSINEHGIFMADEEQNVLKKAILHYSKQAILLIDHTKFEKKDYIILSNFKDYNINKIITDIKPSEEICQSLKANNISLVTI